MRPFPRACRFGNSLRHQHTSYRSFTQPRFLSPLDRRPESFRFFRGFPSPPNGRSFVSSGSLAMEGPSPTQAILEGLRGLKHEKWGWVIYRCTYADDKAWTRFKDVINKRSHEEIAESDSPELANTLEWTYVEDRDTLDGISIPQLRTRFQAWAADAIRTENPRAEGIGLVNHGYPRYSYFIQIDEDALRSVVYEAPQPPAHDEVDIGHVKFVKADWKSMREACSDQVKEDDLVAEEIYEPIDGCREKDVGWVKMPSRLVGPGFYGEMCFDPTLWDDFHVNTSVGPVVDMQ